MDEFVVNRDLLNVLDPDLNLEEFYNRCLDFIKSHFNHKNASYFEFDHDQNSLGLRAISNKKLNQTVYSKLYISHLEENHPYNKAFSSEDISRLDGKKLKETFKYFKVYYSLTGTTNHFLYPIQYKGRKLGLISIDFFSSEESEVFLKKEEEFKIFLEYVSHTVYSIIKNKDINSKYEKYKNLHESSLTLNKLYMDNTQEILKMTLLAVSGIIDANLYLLVISIQKKDSMFVSKLYKHGGELDLSQIHLSEEEKNESSFLMDCKEPTFFNFRDIKFSGRIGFHGREIIALPTFELQDTRYTFLFGRNSLRLFSNDEISITKAFSEVVKITIDNSYLYHRMANQERLEKEVEIASDIQMNLLPRETPLVEGYEFGGFMIPAREIGGDYYDFLPSPDKREVTFAIGDVSGKGVPAGMVMATARTIIHSIIRRKLTLMEILNDLNAYLYNNYKNSVILRFMSLTLLKLNCNENKVYFAGGGHGNILIYRCKTSEVEIIPTGGMVLGISSDIPESPGEISMDIGDSLLLYTDGITECTNSKLEQYEEERLIESFKKHQNFDAKEILLKIYEDLKVFAAGNPQHDDITLVSMKRLV